MKVYFMGLLIFITLYLLYSLVWLNAVHSHSSIRYFLLRYLLYSLVILICKILLQFFVSMIDSWYLVWIVWCSSSRLFSLRPRLELDAWIALTLVLTRRNSIIGTLSNAHVFHHAILPVVCRNTHDSILSERVLFILWCA